MVTSCQDHLAMENEDAEREKNASPSAVKKDENNKKIVLFNETRPFRRNTIIVPGGPFIHTFLNLFVRIEFSSNLSDNYMHINAIYTPQGHSTSKA